MTKGTLTIPGLGVITNLAFLARALETQVNANILSTPTLLTLDNEEARILVGQNIPILTGQYATTGNTTIRAISSLSQPRPCGTSWSIKRVKSGAQSTVAACGASS